MRPCLMVFLLASLLDACQSAPPIVPACHNTPTAARWDEGFFIPISAGTKFLYGKLGIGAGYMGSGPYLDENNVRKEGLHANISITVEGNSSLHQSPSVHEGQIIEIAGYRIFVVKISPAPASSGTDALSPEGGGQRGSILIRLLEPYH